MSIARCPLLVLVLLVMMTACSEPQQEPSEQGPRPTAPVGPEAEQPLPVEGLRLGVVAARDRIGKLFEADEAAEAFWLRFDQTAGQMAVGHLTRSTGAIVESGAVAYERKGNRFTIRNEDGSEFLVFDVLRERGVEEGVFAIRRVRPAAVRLGDDEPGSADARSPTLPGLTPAGWKLGESSPLMLPFRADQVWWRLSDPGL